MTKEIAISSAITLGLVIIGTVVAQKWVMPMFDKK